METAQQSHHLMKRVIDSKTPQECVRTVASPKPNQVGTVLLYGIPIVSLYIEAQERLCLAQISNTLLKQFSYNEIHNRRVALGITCVQCTPVQLEILRRAGAMPVSSRRCGMITRREAERLCKSFLGDNAPPRLPEDFAFSVHHECAWGCRGSFLPSRYNSSRAKCIKCSYCGLFFSPNKFIFHSHRIGPGDKYVQPDAANFNSWRRHMKLSGNPPEEIIHAWEDVKAMFNGGTRKRLMTNSPSSRQSASSPKRIKETQISPPLIHAAAAAAVVSAAATVNVNQFPIRPVNIHHPTSPSTTNPPPRIPNLGAELTLPFSRTFMMDYMWHAQNKSSTFQFPNYTLPWIKRPASLLFTQQSTNGSANNEDTSSPAFNNHNQGCTVNGTTVGSTETESKTIPFYNNSAFKPVINQARKTFPTATALAIGAIIDDEQRTCSRNSKEDCGTIKESLSSDDEMVDIETTEEEHPDNNITCMKFKGDERSISIKLPESPPIEIENSSDMAWEGFMKKENNIRTIGGNMRSTTPVPSILSHSPSSSLASDHQRCTTISPVSPDATVNTLPISIRQNNLSIEHITSSTTPSSSSSSSSAAAAAAAAAVAIAALGHTSNNNINNNNNNSGGSCGGGINIQNNNCPSIILSSTTTTQLTQNNRTGLCNNNNSNNSNNNNNNNNSSHNNNSNNNNINNTISNHNGHEFWSVARFSFDRPEYRIPLYRHDITKHFQNFRHGETTTQTNGVG